MTRRDRDNWALYARALATAWRRPARVKPSRWLHENVKLPKRVSAIHGAYSTDVAPYQREVLDAWVDPEVEEVVVMWGTQTGKTQNIVLLNGFTAACDPGPAFIAAPTSAKAKDLSTQKMEPVYEASPALAGMLPPRRERADLRMELDAQVMYFGWSGSATSLGDVSARYAYFFEIDKYTSKKSTEADPLKLAEERVKFFSNAKKFYDGTPTIKDHSRIERKFLSSDRRRYHVPCPHCGRWQALLWGEKGKPGGLKWPHDKDGNSCDAETARTSAWYECVHCGDRITDAEKMRVEKRGLWVPDGQTARPATRAEIAAASSSSPIREAYDGTPMVVEGTPENPIRRRRGFQLPSWYSPVLTFGQCAAAWLESQGDFREEQNFVNSWKAEAWDMLPAALEFQELFERCHDDRDPGQVPAEALALILTADFQKAVIYWVLRGWALEGASWLVAEGQTPSIDELRGMFLASRWPVVGVDEARAIDLFATDARYRKSEVEDLVISLGPRARAFMGGGLKYGSFKFQADKSSAVTGKALRLGFGHWALCSDYYQDKLDSMMHRPKGHPNRWRLHREPRELYLKMVTSEVLEESHDARGRPVMKRKMVEGAPGNHLRDCECYQIAAWEMWRMGWARVAAPRRPRPRPDEERDRRPDSGEGQGGWDGTID